MPEALFEGIDTRVARHEPWVVFLLGTLGLVAIPLWLGYIGISWDAVNHHFYLGWTAEHPRFDQDYLAASYQGYQFPYLYWPVYKLAMAGVSGVTAGVVLALLHATAIPAIWMIARNCVPGEDWFSAGMRALAVLLAFMSGLVLSLFETTSNDLLASIPLLWAYAFGLRPLAVPQASPLRCALVSGLFAGVAVAFKLSNGPLALMLPLLWVWSRGTPPQRLARCILAGVCLLASCFVVYGYWGWQLWTHYGNPIYPLYDGAFEGLRDAVGWHR
jgi:hypothetical protein